MPSKHLILCHPLLLLPSIFPSIRVFSNESVFHIRWQNIFQIPTPPKSWSITYLRSIHWPYLSPSASFILFLSWAYSLPSFNTESLNFFPVLFLVSLWNYHSTPASALIFSPHIQFLPLSKQLHHVKASESSLCRNRKGFLIISPSALPLFFMLFDIAAGFTSWNVLLSWHLQQWIELNWHSHKRMNEVKLFEIVLKC